jgi:hypothetical protein
MKRTLIKYIFIACCAFPINHFAVAQQLPDGWYTFSIEFTGPIKLGEIVPFRVANIVFDDGIQIYPEGMEPIKETGAYLIREGIVDRIASGTPQIADGSSTENPLPVTMEGADNKGQLTIRIPYEIVELEGKEIASYNILFTGAKHASGSKAQPTFNKNARCLMIREKQFDQPTFYFPRQRFSPFKSLDDFEKYRKSKSGNSILEIERGIWSGYNWSNIRAVGYKGQIYYSSAVEYNQKIYLASFKQAGANEEVFTKCSAYNSAAINDIQNLFGKPSEGINK